MKHNNSPKTPPPTSGTGNPPKPNEVDLTQLIDDYIEANKDGKGK